MYYKEPAAELCREPVRRHHDVRKRRGGGPMGVRDRDLERLAQRSNDTLAAVACPDADTFNTLVAGHLPAERR